MEASTIQGVTTVLSSRGSRQNADLTKAGRKLEDADYWRKQAGWYDDDYRMKQYNENAQSHRTGGLYNGDDDRVKSHGGGSSGIADTASMLAWNLLGIVIVLITLASIILIARAIKRKLEKSSSKEEDAEKSRRSSRSRSKSRSRSRSSAKNGELSDYHLMDDKDKHGSRSKSHHRSKSGSRGSRSRSRSRARTSNEKATSSDPSELMLV